MIFSEEEKKRFIRSKNEKLPEGAGKGAGAAAGAGEFLEQEELMVPENNKENVEWLIHIYYEELPL